MLKVCGTCGTVWAVNIKRKKCDCGGWLRKRKIQYHSSSWDNFK